MHLTVLTQLTSTKTGIGFMPTDLPCKSANTGFTLASSRRKLDAAPDEKGAKTARGKLRRTDWRWSQICSAQIGEAIARNAGNVQLARNKLNSNCEIPSALPDSS